MKKYLFIFTAFTFIAVTFYGCKKQTSYPVPPNSGFVQFQLDGQEYQYYAQNNAAAYGTVSFSNTPTHAVQITFYASPTDASFQNVTLEQVSAAPLQDTNYVYTGYNVSQYPQFTFESTNLFRYTLTGSSTGNIRFTRLDTVAGGLVQGSFNFYNLEALNQDNTVESASHNITNGTFSITVGK